MLDFKEYIFMVHRLLVVLVGLFSDAVWQHGPYRLWSFFIFFFSFCSCVVSLLLVLVLSVDDLLMPLVLSDDDLLLFLRAFVFVLFFEVFLILVVQA